MLLGRVACRPVALRPVPPRLRRLRQHELRGHLASACCRLDRAAGDPGADATSVDVLILGVRSIVALVEGAPYGRPPTWWGRSRRRVTSPTAGGPTRSSPRSPGRHRSEHGDPGRPPPPLTGPAGRHRPRHVDDRGRCLHRARPGAPRCGDAAGTFEHLAHARSLRPRGGHARRCWPGSTPPRCGPASPSTTSTGPTAALGVPQGCRGVLEASPRPGQGRRRPGVGPPWAATPCGCPCGCASSARRCWPAPRRATGAGRVPHRPGAGLAEPEGYRTSILAGGAGPAALRWCVTWWSAQWDAGGPATSPRSPRRPSRAAGRRPCPGRGRSLADPLTPAEERVLFYLASNLTVAELARQLGVSLNTVKTQLKGVYRKLEVNSARPPPSACPRPALSARPLQEALAGDDAPTCTAPPQPPGPPTAAPTRSPRPRCPARPLRRR